MVLLEYPYSVMYQGRTYEDLAGEYLVSVGGWCGRGGRMCVPTGSLPAASPARPSTTI